MDGLKGAKPRFGSLHQNRLHLGAAAHKLPCLFSPRFQQNRQGLTDADLIKGLLAFPDEGLQTVKTFPLDVLRHLQGLQRCRCPRTGAIGKGIGLRVAHGLDQGKGVFEIGIIFPGKTNNKIRRKPDIGAGLPQALYDGEILCPRMFAVHGPQDFVRSGLNGQMQKGH